MTDRPTLDGFYPRRPNTRGENINSGGGMGFNDSEPTRYRHNPPAPQVLRPSAPVVQAKDTFRMPYSSQAHQAVAPTYQTAQPGLQRSELEDSLREIDQEEPGALPEHPRKKRRAKGDSTPTRRKLLTRRVIIALALLLLAIGAFFAIRIMMASQPIFKGDLFGLVQQVPLQMDENGRTNILIYGTSEDDEGGDHPGAYLTDSIMLLSVDQNKKDAYMVGIPRDLWVDYGGTCVWGMEGKINALYSCYSDNGKDDAEGSEALAAKISEVTGLKTQYYAHVNYGVVREAVDAVGGIDMTIPDYDPGSPGIYDPNFDWKCQHKCKMVNYKDGESVHMDGEHALAFARARNAAGGYGLPNGDFNRAQNQQLVLVSLRQKALSAGTLVNLAAVTGLVEAMGNNLRTNFQTNEIRTLMSLGNDIQQDSIHSISLNKDGEMAVTTGSSADGQSIVRPVSGIDDYSSIVKYIKKQINAEPFMLEDATVAVLNGSGVVGQGRAAADKLADMGFSIGDVANAPVGTYAYREVYARDESSYPGTRDKLKSLYSNMQVGTEKFNLGDDIDFVVVVGQVTEMAPAVEQ